MKNVKECLKDISLETIFRNILWENDKKKKNLLTVFYISYKSEVKTFLI